MGLSWSKRRNNNIYQNTSPSLRISSYPSDPSPLPSSSSNPPLPSSSSNPPLPPPNYVFAANAPYPAPPYPPQNSYPTPYPPLPPHPSYNQYYPMGRSNYHPYYNRPSMVPPQPTPLPYIEHQKAKKIRSDLNVHKDTIRIEVDENNPEYHLVSFTLDAMVDGSITIFYFAKEGTNCQFTPLYPEAHRPMKVSFQKGLGQKFRQPSGTGIDLGFFELDDLSKPSPSEDVFPLVIFAEACSPPLPTDEQNDQPLPTTSHAQITQAILEHNNVGPFQVKVIKQILWVDEVRYELREIYGIGNSAEAGFDDNDPGKECVICMSEPKDTAVMPCRHMCMCSECAKELRLQTNKCPICRQPIEQLIEINSSKGDQ